jgi:hypothetical protein
MPRLVVSMANKNEIFLCTGSVTQSSHRYLVRNLVAPSRHECAVPPHALPAAASRLLPTPRPLFALAFASTCSFSAAGKRSVAQIDDDGVVRVCVSIRVRAWLLHLRLFIIILLLLFNTIATATAGTSKCLFSRCICPLLIPATLS